MKNTKKLVTTAILSAMAAILMLIDFSVPFMPGFIKLDISELPALIGTFAYGPACGITVCLLKNLINLASTTTGGVGEAANFILGVCFVLPAGLIYRHKKSRKIALLSCIVGSAAMAVCCVPINYFVTYPVYAKFMPLENIIAAYNAIFPTGCGLLGCLVIFNMPFTFAKGILCSAVTFLVYKRISEIIKKEK